jgi:hypothetical protein
VILGSSAPGMWGMTQGRVLRMKDFSFLYTNGRVFPAIALLLLSLLSVMPAYSAEVTLGWSPNSESDLEGYGIYYHKNSSGPPFSLAGYVKLNELADVNDPTFAVSGLDSDTEYIFAVTAYDTEGLESDFSQSICVNTDAENSLCSSSNTVQRSNDDSGGGGGGGGCFIEIIQRQAAPGKD